MQIIDPFVTRPSPHPKASSWSSTLKMLCAMERINIFSFVVFTFELGFES
jgi:hypothetical protein